MVSIERGGYGLHPIASGAEQNNNDLVDKLSEITHDRVSVDLAKRYLQKMPQGQRGQLLQEWVVLAKKPNCTPEERAQSKRFAQTLYAVLADKKTPDVVKRNIDTFLLTEGISDGRLHILRRQPVKPGDSFESDVLKMVAGEDGNMHVYTRNSPDADWREVSDPSGSGKEDNRILQNRIEVSQTVEISKASESDRIEYGQLIQDETALDKELAGLNARDNKSIESVIRAIDHFLGKYEKLAGVPSPDTAKMTQYKEALEKLETVNTARAALTDALGEATPENIAEIREGAYTAYKTALLAYGVEAAAVPAFETLISDNPAYNAQEKVNTETLAAYNRGAENVRNLQQRSEAAIAKFKADPGETNYKNAETAYKNFYEASKAFAEKQGINFEQLQLTPPEEMFTKIQNENPGYVTEERRLTDLETAAKNAAEAMQTAQSEFNRGITKGTVDREKHWPVYQNYVTAMQAIGKMTELNSGAKIRASFERLFTPDSSLYVITVNGRTLLNIPESIQTQIKPQMAIISATIMAFIGYEHNFVKSIDINTELSKVQTAAAEIERLVKGLKNSAGEVLYPDFEVKINPIVFMNTSNGRNNIDLYLSEDLHNVALLAQMMKEANETSLETFLSEQDKKQYTEQDIEQGKWLDILIANYKENNPEIWRAITARDEKELLAENKDLLYQYQLQHPAWGGKARVQAFLGKIDEFNAGRKLEDQLKYTDESLVFFSVNGDTSTLRDYVGDNVIQYGQELIRQTDTGSMTIKCSDDGRAGGFAVRMTAKPEQQYVMRFNPAAIERPVNNLPRTLTAYQCGELTPFAPPEFQTANNLPRYNITIAEAPVQAAPADPGRTIPPLCENLRDTIYLPVQAADEEQFVTQAKTYPLPITYASGGKAGNPVLVGDLPEGITSEQVKIGDDGQLYVNGLPPGEYSFAYAVENAGSEKPEKIGAGQITLRVEQDIVVVDKVEPIPLGYYVKGDIGYNSKDGGRQRVEAGVSYDRISGQIYYEGNNLQTVKGLVNQLIKGEITYDLTKIDSSYLKAAVAVFGAMQYGIAETEQKVTVADKIYRPTDKLFADKTGKTEFSAAELKILRDTGQISEIQYRDALAQGPHQAAPESQGIVSGPDLTASDEYVLKTPAAGDPAYTRADLKAKGYSDTQIDAMTEATGGGYSDTGTVGETITVRAGQPNPVIEANPEAYKKVGEPYGIGEPVTATSAAEAAQKAAEAGRAGLPADEDSWLRTPTGQTIYSDTPVEEKDIPKKYTPDECLKVPPDPPYDTTRFDPNSKSYTLEETKGLPPGSYGPTGGKITTGNYHHADYTVPSIPEGANKDHYKEVPPDPPYGEIDSTAGALTPEELAKADPASFGPTGAKTGARIVPGSARPVEDDYGTPYAGSDCRAVSWGAEVLPGSSPSEPFDWVKISEREPGFQYVETAGVFKSTLTHAPTTGDKIAGETYDAALFDFNSRNLAIAGEKEIFLDHPSIKLDDVRTLADLGLNITLPAGYSGKIVFGGKTIPYPGDLSQYEIKNDLNQSNSHAIDIYLVDGQTGIEYLQGKIALNIKSSGKQRPQINMTLAHVGSSPEVFDVYRKQGTKQPLTPASWEVPVFEYKPRLKNPPTYYPPVYEEVAEYKLYVRNPTLYRPPTDETEYAYQLKAQDWIQRESIKPTYYEPQYEHFAPRQEAFSVRVFEHGGDETTVLTGKQRDQELATVLGLTWEVEGTIYKDNDKKVELTARTSGAIGYKVTHFESENDFSVQNGNSLIANADGTYAERTISGVPEEFTENGGQIVYDMRAGVGLKIKDVRFYVDGIIRKDAVSAKEQDGFNIDSPEDIFTKGGVEAGASWESGAVIARYLESIEGVNEFWLAIEQNVGRHFKTGVETDLEKHITGHASTSFDNGVSLTSSIRRNMFGGRTTSDIFGLQSTLTDDDSASFDLGTGAAYSKVFDNQFFTGVTAGADFSYNTQSGKFSHGYKVGTGLIPTKSGRSLFEIEGVIAFSGLDLEGISGQVLFNFARNWQAYILTHLPFGPAPESKTAFGLKFDIEKPK
ncbi:MAG: hypothetical protein LBQ83_03960 [Candidatus Margulisbacteria bacterium]|jgi:hypothetical protein|nr:hypothetical protein [Candidatus Margulisiibacteriota bacterium]